MEKKNKLFPIIAISMSVICAVRMVGAASDLLDFGLGVFVGIVIFIMGFMFLGVMNLIFGVFYKILLGNTKIYKWLKKLFHIWISFTLIMSFFLSCMLCLATWIDGSAIYFFPQCMASGSFVGTWIYKNILEERIVDNIKISRES